METADTRPASTEVPPPRLRRPGCLATVCLTALAAMIVAAVVVWKFFDASEGLMEGGVSFLRGLPEKFQTQHITETFRESITRVDPTHGDILEVATLESDETVAKLDEKSLFNDTLYIGSTLSEIRVPVVYRYHIKISDDWKLSTSGNVVTVVAPVIRPSLPPAIRTERMEKKSESGWLRFNKAENLAALEKSLTSSLERRAASPGKMSHVREPGRKAVAEFVKRWLLTEGQWKEGAFGAIVVVFADEPEAKEIDRIKALPSTLRL